MTKWIISKHSQIPDRIWIGIPYNPELIEDLKDCVPGVRWDKQGRVWHAPLDMQVCQDIAALARSWGAGLTIRPDVADWARSEKTRVAGIVAPTDVSRNFDLLSNLRATRHELIEAMSEKPWQIPGAQFIASQRRVIVADEPGLGKTVQAIAALVEENVTGPILVVAPKSAVDITWPDEIERWLGTSEIVARISADMKPAERRLMIDYAGQIQTKRCWVLIGPSYLRIRADLDNHGNFVRDANGRKIIRVVNHAIPELFSVEWSAVIVDESHETLAGQSPGVGKRKWSAQRLGLSALRIKTGGFRIAMSGTPFRGKTENIFGTLQWLAPDKYTSFWNWVKRHYGITDSFTGFGAGIIKGDQILDETRFFNELKPYMIRRTYGEVAKDMPPKFYGGTHLDPTDDDSPIAVWLPLTKAQERQYDKVVKEALLYLGSEQWTVNGALAEMVRLKQIANSCLIAGDKAIADVPSNKVSWLLDFLRERQESGIKVLVASQFTSFLKMVSEELNKAKIDHYMLTGQTSSKSRVAQRSAFQADGGASVFLLNTKAGGVSLTLDAADDVVICDQTWIPDDQLQIENRAYRVSRYHHVNIWYLASLNTIDEDIAVLNNQREGAIFSVLDKQRGVSLVKALVAKTKNRTRKIA
jgi:SNF2 family DNA or RNA helicase